MMRSCVENQERTVSTVTMPLVEPVYLTIAWAKKISIRFGIFSAANGRVPNCNSPASLLWKPDGPLLFRPT